tara:strand:+ start:2156 stop:2572 length:417 start_codon:yes stop_codon:yes gene_type:complete
MSFFFLNDQLQTMSTETEGEYQFNECVRAKSPSPLIRSMSVPFPDHSAERRPWCSVTMCFVLCKAKNQHIYDVWNKVIRRIHGKVGYVRGGTRSETRTTITITGKIDVFGEIKLYDLQDKLEEDTGCRIHIDQVMTIN